MRFISTLEKGVAQGRQNATAIAQQLPTSYVVKQNVGGIPHDVRRLTASVFERAVESAIGRGLLERSNRNNPWAVINAFFSGMFDDHTIEWLNKRGYLRWDQRVNYRRRQCADRTASLRRVRALSALFEFRYWESSWHMAGLTETTRMTRKRHRSFQPPWCAVMRLLSEAREMV